MDETTKISSSKHNQQIFFFTLSELKGKKHLDYKILPKINNSIGVKFWHIFDKRPLFLSEISTSNFECFLCDYLTISEFK